MGGRILPDELLGRGLHIQLLRQGQNTRGGYIEREGERERDRDREKDRQTDRKAYRDKERDTDQCILLEIQAGIEPAVPIHLAYSIDTLKLSAKSTEREIARK